MFVCRSVTSPRKQVSEMFNIFRRKPVHERFKGFESIATDGKPDAEFVKTIIEITDALMAVDLRSGGPIVLPLSSLTGPITIAAAALASGGLVAVPFGSQSGALATHEYVIGAGRCLREAGISLAIDQRLKLVFFEPKDISFVCRLAVHLRQLTSEQKYSFDDLCVAVWFAGFTVANILTDLESGLLQYVDKLHISSEL